MARRTSRLAIALATLAGCGGGGGDGDAPGCGDGVVQSGEACDDGAKNSDTDADACRTTCLAARCGDGVVDKGESCDDGADNSDKTPDACRSDCLPPTCGDAVVDDGEDCDAGEANSDDDPDACREDCAAAGCGDGVMDTGEACDDGDMVETNDCANDCTTDALWTQQMSGAVATGLAMDSAGNLVVVGAAPAFGPGSDLWVRKYDADGTMIWTQTYDGLGGTAQGWGVAVDAADNVVVAGIESTVAGDADIWVRKYDPSGGTTWTQTFGGAIAGDETVGRVAVDGTGNVVVAGAEALAPIMGGWITDGWIRKYDPSGTLLWTQTYTGMFGGIDYASGVAIDASGNVLATGLENNRQSAWVQKYDAAGTPVWTQFYRGAENMYAEGTGVAIDGSGNVVVTGLEVSTAGLVDIFVRKLDPDGNELWTRSYDGPAHGQDQSRDIWVDGDDNVLVTGFEIAGTVPDVVTLKYDSSGTLLWIRTSSGPGNREDVGTGVRADTDGNVFVVGSRQTTSGIDVWLRKYLP